jgi:hypothetical protein
MTDVREIPLTQGHVTLVDAADFDFLLQWKWRTFDGGRGHICAITNVHTPKGRRSAYLHRVLMQPAPGFVVDHIDGDPLNNTRANMRVCTRAENTRNGKKRCGSNPYKGVFTDKRWPRRFIAAIGVDYRHIVIGRFDCPVEAAHAYDAKARELHGEFARLNFPEAA